MSFAQTLGYIKGASDRFIGRSFVYAALVVDASVYARDVSARRHAHEAIFRPGIFLRDRIDDFAADDVGDETGRSDDGNLVDEFESTYRRADVGFTRDACDVTTRSAIIEE